MRSRFKKDSSNKNSGNGSETSNLLKEKRKAKIEKAKNIADIGFSGFSIPEGSNFAVIFLMHISNTFLNILLSPPMRFICFPIAAICGLVKAGFNWYKFHQIRKDKASTKEDKVISFLQAFWETLNGLGTTGAVVTGIVGFFIGASVGMGISITFNFFLATSTAVCAAFSIYYGVTAYKAYKAYKAHKELKEQAKKTTEEEKLMAEKYAEFKSRRKGALISLAWAGIVALLTAGVVAAMVIGSPVIGPVLGIVGCACAVAFSAYFLHLALKRRKELKLQQTVSYNSENASSDSDDSTHSINESLRSSSSSKSENSKKSFSKKSSSESEHSKSSKKDKIQKSGSDPIVGKLSSGDEVYSSIDSEVHENAKQCSQHEETKSNFSDFDCPSPEEERKELSCSSGQEEESKDQSFSSNQDENQSSPLIAYSKFEPRDKIQHRRTAKNDLNPENHSHRIANL